jgi:hypothetical protein
MVQFPQYAIESANGVEFIPYFKNGQWYINGDEITLATLSRICKIPEDEVILLCLAYGK